MKNEKKWYAVHTRANWEQKTALLLKKKNIESYCPLNRASNQWGRKREANQPLFESYVFVYAAVAEHATILKTDGVINFIYWLDKPVVVRESEIQSIRTFLDEHAAVALEKIKMNAEDAVRVTGGTFMQREGNVVEVSTRKVKMMLPSFGYTMVAELPQPSTEVMAGKKYIRASYAY